MNKVFIICALILLVNTSIATPNKLKRSKSNQSKLANNINIQKLFQAASLFTVKTRTRVPIPFFSDSRSISSGSGFLIDKERAWILTNQHVVSSSPSEIKIKFKNSMYINAKKIYIDPLLDLAVIAINPKKLPKNALTAKLDCGKLPVAGIPVGAFGHPRGRIFTVTRGIISGISNDRVRGIMLQTDAPLNPGNSGGALVNLLNGKVVGINTSVSKRGQNENYATPMKQVCDIISLLKQGKDPSPPLLSYNYYIDFDGTKKLTIAHVGQSNNKHQLQKGDTIIRINNLKNKIEYKSDLIHSLRGRLNNVNITVKRNNKIITHRASFTATKKINARYGLLFYGALYGENRLVANNNFIRGKPAVMVHYVKPSSLSYSNHIRKKDYVISLNKTKISSLEQFHCELIKISRTAKTVNIKLLRLDARNQHPYIYKLSQLDLSASKKIIEIIGDRHEVKRNKLRISALQCANKTNNN